MTFIARAIIGRRPASLAAVLAVLGTCAGGCRSEPEGYDRYIPEPATGRAAVQAMLECWREGRPADEVAGTNPKVSVVDKHRLPGQRLTRYQILGEVSADNARAYAVRLTFADPVQQQVARFLVVGIDPLWVFRQEDYEMISHWMHPMDRPKDQDQVADPGQAP